MTDGKLRLLTCVAVPLAERVEGCFGFAGPVGGAGPTGAGGHRLAQVVRADFLGVVGGCFTPVCNTATASQQEGPSEMLRPGARTDSTVQERDSSIQYSQIKRDEFLLEFFKTKWLDQ